LGRTRLVLELEDVSRKRYRFLYLDMHDARMHTPAYFSASVLHHLDIPTKHTNLEKQPMAVLINVLEDQRCQNRSMPILPSSYWMNLKKSRSTKTSSTTIFWKHCAPFAMPGCLFL
jgi:hypothetical protein